MKKNLFFLFAAVSATFIACTKEQVETQAEMPACELSISVNSDTKSTLNTDGKSVLWLKDDILFVSYEGESQTIQFANTSETKQASAVFATNQWPEGSTPKYASCFGKRLGRALYSDGKMAVHITDEQKMMWKGNYYKSAAASVGKVEKIGGNYVVQEMKNVMGLIKFTLSTSKVARIYVEAIGGEMLCGTAAIDYDKLAKGDEDFWTPIPSPDPETTDYNMSYINVCPANNEASTIIAGSFYICAYPQNYSKGLRFTLYDVNEEIIAVRTVGATDGFKLVRNEIREIKSSMDDVDTLPETIELNLAFYNDSDTNPLGTFVENNKQNATTGEEYEFSYSYKYYDKTKTVKFPFVICKGEVDKAWYSYFAADALVYGTQGRKILVMNKDQFWIKLPGIEGRYLKSVTVSHGNAYVKSVQIRITPDNASNLGYTSAATGQIATSESLNVQTISFPNTQYSPARSTESGKSYYLFGTASKSASMRIYNLKLVYTKTL